MIKNYFKIALRNLLKNKMFSITNIAGLGIGIACCLLIMLFVHYELSYDRWNPNSDRIYRIYSDINFGGTLMNMAVVGAPVGPDTEAALPDVEAWCRFRNYGSYLVRKDGEGISNTKEDHILSVDSSFFTLFPVKLLVGNSEECLRNPNSMVVAKSKALKYFTSIDEAMGATMILENEERWNIQGVFEDLPPTNHFTADILLSLTGNQEIADSPPLWAANNNFQTYFMVKDGTSPADFNQKFIALSREKMEETSRQLLGLSLEEFEATGQFARYAPQPLTAIHLHSDLQVELEPNGSIKYVYIFSAIALFVLLIACINFMNLTTAKSAQRGKEIGIRKVLGSNRAGLISQFFSETFLMTILAVIFALVLAGFVMPWFNQLTGREIHIPWDQSIFWIIIAGGIFIVGLLAGSYPALYLSGFEPVQSFKGHFSGSGKENNLRSILVIFQFTISTVLIIGTIVIYNQLKFVQSKNLGFSKEQVIAVNDAYALGENVNAYKQRLLQNPAIEKATVSSYLPIPSSRSNTTFSKVREFREDQAINMGNWNVDYEYLATLGMEMTSGRFFDISFPTDSQAVVINEAAASILGFTDAIDKNLYGLSNNFSGAPRPEDFIKYKIIGVVSDFHFESLRENIGALGMFLKRSTGKITFRYKAEDSQQVLADLEKNWKEMAPDQPFSYQFLDESFRRIYESEQRIGSIALIFSLLAIFVSCLGLFGLASFITELRTKEIGIRKVLGASTVGIVALLSRDFIKLVFIALILAIPLAWWGMHRWLADFAYRIDIKWSIFVLAGILSLFIAFFTVSFQSIKAAFSDPVHSIRSE